MNSPTYESTLPLSLLCAVDSGDGRHVFRLVLQACLDGSRVMKMSRCQLLSKPVSEEQRLPSWLPVKCDETNIHFLKLCTFTQQAVNAGEYKEAEFQYHQALELLTVSPYSASKPFLKARGLANKKVCLQNVLGTFVYKNVVRLTIWAIKFILCIRSWPASI